MWRGVDPGVWLQAAAPRHFLALRDERHWQCGARAVGHPRAVRAGRSAVQSFLAAIQYTCAATQAKIGVDRDINEADGDALGLDQLNNPFFCPSCDDVCLRLFNGGGCIVAPSFVVVDDGGGSGISVDGKQREVGGGGAA
jgi:hypothetical protein